MQATKKVATLALKIKQLKAFVHVSTAYVNCNLPRGSHIEEQIYPLYHKDGKKVEHKKLAIKLAAMAPNKAEAEVGPPSRLSWRQQQLYHHAGSYPGQCLEGSSLGALPCANQSCRVALWAHPCHSPLDHAATRAAFPPVFMQRL